MHVDKDWPTDPVSYQAIADGSKKHNMARVYAGHYLCDEHRVPCILISKCGTPEEASGSKAGNRGKRDSQIILMSFFKKVTFDEPMSPLEYDMFGKVVHLMKVTPNRFEIILMVDADTRVEPDSLSRMVAVMVRDPLVIGLCGETRIMNKSESWVSRIQVFEYYLSHHLQKTFESIFGSVTCLPGCFCMWRIVFVS
jgi:chitin synthase